MTGATRLSQHQVTPPAGLDSERNPRPLPQTALRPHWATLTGVLEAMQRRRERLRAAALAQAQGLPAPGAGAAGLEVKEEQVSGGGEPRVKEEPRSDDSLAGNHDSAEGP